MTKQVVAVLGVMAALALIVLLVWQPGATTPAPPAAREVVEDAGAPVLLPGANKALPDAAPTAPSEVTPREKAPAPLHRIHGRVVHDDTGEGIAGVRLFCLHSHESFRVRRDPRVGVTAHDGTFEVEGLAPGRWILLPFHLRYTHETLGTLLRERSKETLAKARAAGLVFDVPGPRTGDAPLELRMRPGAEIRGRVVDEAGHPVHGAAIRVHMPYMLARHLDVSLGRHAKHMALARSGRDGTFVVTCLPTSLGAARLGAFKDGLVGKWTDAIDLEKPGELELTLVAYAQVRGHVRWTDGAPVEDAQVRLLGISRNWAVRREYAYTDAQGAFELTRAVPGATRVRARVKGSTHNGEAKVEPLVAGEALTDVVIEVERARVLQGVVTTRDGTPIEGERIEARAEGVGGDDLDYDETGEDGRFKLYLATQVPIDLWLITADRDVRVKQGVTGTADVTLVVDPTPRATLRVHVVDPDGKRIPQFLFQAWARYEGDMPRAVRSKKGVGQREVLGAPPYFVRVSEPRDATGTSLALPPVTRELFAAPDGVLTIRLSDESEYLGTVLDEDGKPVDGARVRFEGRDLPIDARGRFRFTSARTKPVGLELVVPSGYWSGSLSKVAEVGKPVDFVLRPGGKALRGRLEARQGAPDLSGLEVHADWPMIDEDDDAEALATTDSSGAFVFEGLPASPHIVLTVDREELAKRGLYLERPHTRTRAGSDVVLEVGAALSISGRLTGAGLEGRDVAKLRVDVVKWFGVRQRHLRITQPTADAPQFHIAGLAPGRYSLVCTETTSKRRRILVTRARVEAGSSDVVLTVPRNDAVIEGTVNLTELSDSSDLFAVVWFQDGSLQVAGHAEISPDGSFRIDHLPRGQRYTVSLQSQFGGLDRWAKTEDVEPGHPVRLVPKHGGFIEGKIVAPEGHEPLLFVHAEGKHTLTMGFADEGTQKFRVGPLPPGRYRIVVIGRGLIEVASLPRVIPGTKGLELVVK